MPSWVKSNEVYTCGDGHSGPTVIWAGPNVTPLERKPVNAWSNTWLTVDLKPLGVTADAIWADIVGHLVITHGNDAGIANLTATFRAPGSTLGNGNYQMQAIAEFIGSGSRGSQSVRVPLVNGCFEFFWNCERTGIVTPDTPYPGGSAYLINLWLQAWGRHAAPASGGGSGIPAEGINVRLVPA